MTTILWCAIITTNITNSDTRKGQVRLKGRKVFAVRLKELRKNAKLKIEQVAADTGMTVRALRSYETGNRTPKDDTKMTLCNYYGVKVGEIFFT